MGLLVFGLAGCDGDRLYEDFQIIPDQSWALNDTVRFDLSSLKTTGSTHLIGFRFTDGYPFTNAYVKLVGKDSLGQTLQEELVNVILFDPKSGKPNGKGFGDVHTFYDTLDFKPKNGIASLEILQYMRENQLEGIEAIGFKILK